MDENLTVEEVKHELEAWKSAFKERQLSHAVVKYETAIYLLKDYYALVSKTAFPSLAKRTADFLEATDN